MNSDKFNESSLPRLDFAPEMEARTAEFAFSNNYGEAEVEGGEIVTSALAHRSVSNVAFYLFSLLFTEHKYPNVAPNRGRLRAKRFLMKHGRK